MTGAVATDSSSRSMSPACPQGYRVRGYSINKISRVGGDGSRRRGGERIGSDA